MTPFANLMLVRALEEERHAAARNIRIREPEFGADFISRPRRSWAAILRFPRLQLSNAQTKA